MSNDIILSNLGHTWIFDIDGTLVKHNGYLIDGHDTILPGVKEFFKNSIKDDDYVILVTSRDEKYKDLTISFLKDNNIKYNNILFNLPFGERILINDKKPSGLKMSTAVNLDRNSFNLKAIIDEEL